VAQKEKTPLRSVRKKERCDILSLEAEKKLPQFMWTVNRKNEVKVDGFTRVFTSTWPGFAEIVQALPILHPNERKPLPSVHGHQDADPCICLDSGQLEGSLVDFLRGEK
jgi:hypothetical protein